MMNAVVDVGLLRPLIVGNQAITHPIFAYDLMVFAKRTESNARSIKSILHCFSWFSGFAMNESKSHLFNSKNVDKEKLSRCMGIQDASLPSVYLGLPLFPGHLTKSLCQSLIDKISKRLSSWQTRLLSMARRVELVIST